MVLSLLVLRVGVSKNGSKMGRKWVDFGNFSSEPTAWLRDLRKMAISKSVKNHLFWSFCGFKPTDFENRGFKKRGQKWVKIAAGGSAGVQQGVQK